MPFSESFERGVALIVGHGEGDFTSWLAALERVAASPLFLEGMPIVCDCRGVEKLPLPGEAQRIANAYARTVRHHRVGLVVTEGASFGVARQISTYSRGQVEAFTDMEAAWKWVEGMAPPPVPS